MNVCVAERRPVAGKGRRKESGPRIGGCEGSGARQTPARVRLCSGDGTSQGRKSKCREDERRICMERRNSG